MRYVIEVTEAISPDAYNRESVMEREMLGVAFRRAIPVIEVKPTAELDTAFIPGDDTDPGVFTLDKQVVRVFATEPKPQ